MTADSSVPAEYTLSILMLTVLSMFSLAVVARVLLLDDCGTTAPPSGCAAAPKADAHAGLGSKRKRVEDTAEVKAVTSSPAAKSAKTPLLSRLQSPMSLRR